MPARNPFRSVLPFLAVLALAAGLGCRSSDTVRIGFVGDLISELGAGGRNGAQLAVETLDAAPGAHYELLVQDDRNDADAARAAIASFASHGAAFAVGPMTSEMAVAAVPEADRHKLVLISPTATTDELSGKDDWFFRNAADAPAGARQLARLVHDRGARSLVVLMDSANRAYSRSFGHAAAVEFRSLAGASAAEIEYRSGNSLDFSEVMRRLAETPCDAVILVNSPGDAAIVTQHLRRVAPKVAIALSPWGANVQYLQVGGRATEGAIALQAIDLASPLPRMRDFVERYRTRFGELPTTPAVQGYEAVMLGVDALKRGGAASLRETLSVPATWQGLDGDYALDAHGDARRDLHLMEVREGRFVTLRR
jgi:branched-chain amino acid transport system substrate-binding protein